MTLVTVVIPAFNAEGTLPATLVALANQTYGGEIEVVVADDGSTDRTAEIARSSGLVTRIVAQINQGPAAARNLAVAESSGELIAFTDADCVPASTWLEAGLAELADTDIVQGAVRPLPGGGHGPFARTIWVVRESGLYETANLFCRRSLFERIGGFEAWLEVGAEKQLAEDAWFGWRARRGGAATKFCEEALVHHAVFERSARAYISDRRRLRHFPAIVSRIPELRRTLFFMRYFLDRHTAWFDIALVAVLAAAITLNPLPLIMVLPYLVMVGSRALRLRAPQILPVEIAADLHGLARLAAASIKHRRLVI